MPPRRGEGECSRTYGRSQSGRGADTDGLAAYGRSLSGISRGLVVPSERSVTQSILMSSIARSIGALGVDTAAGSIGSGRNSASIDTPTAMAEEAYMEHREIK